MRLSIGIIILLFSSLAWGSHIFHLEKKSGKCQWKLYNVEKSKDKIYYRTDKCPTQIVWLKDKSFYFSIKNDIFWARPGVKKPKKVVNFKTARKGYYHASEVIWGVKGKHNSIYAMVIDPHLKYTRVQRQDSYEFRGKAIDADSFTGTGNEPRAAGIIRRWSVKKKSWKTTKLKVVGRYNNNGFDDDLYNNSVLSSRQIVHYNECGGNNCERLPSSSSWDVSKWEKQLRFIDDGIQSMGYLELGGGKGLLFKKALGENLHPVKPFLLCEDDCEKTTELELPKSFSDNFSLVKKGQHYLVTNEDRGSIGNLYSFNSPKPIKTFKGPMVFWHPF